MEKNDSKWTIKRIAAVIGLICIAIMVIATLVTAVIDSSGRYFRSCLIVTIALPIALWIFLWALGLMTGKHNIASVDLNLSQQNKAENDETDSSKTSEE